MQEEHGVLEIRNEASKIKCRSVDEGSCLLLSKRYDTHFKLQASVKRTLLNLRGGISQLDGWKQEITSANKTRLCCSLYAVNTLVCSCPVHHGNVITCCCLVGTSVLTVCRHQRRMIFLSGWLAIRVPALCVSYGRCLSTDNSSVATSVIDPWWRECRADPSKVSAANCNRDWCNQSGLLKLFRRIVQLENEHHTICSRRVGNVSHFCFMSRFWPWYCLTSRLCKSGHKLFRAIQPISSQRRTYATWRRHHFRLHRHGAAPYVLLNNKLSIRGDRIFQRKSLLSGRWVNSFVQFVDVRSTFMRSIDKLICSSISNIGTV